MGREEHSKKNITGMCEECLQSMDHTGSAPAHGGMCFLDLHCSGFRLLSRVTVQSARCVLCTSQVWAAQVQVLGYSTGAQTQLCTCFVPFPGPSSSGNQLLGEHTVPRGPCILITFPVPGTWFPRCIVRALSQLTSGELISGCDPPGRCQPFRIPGRLG